MATKKPRKGNIKITEVSWGEDFIKAGQTGSYFPSEIQGNGSIVSRKSFSVFTITKQELIILSRRLSDNYFQFPSAYTNFYLRDFFLSTEFSKEKNKIFDEFLNYLQKKYYTITNIVHSPLFTVSFEIMNTPLNTIDEIQHAIITRCIKKAQLRSKQKISHELNLNFFGNISPEQKATIMHYLSQIYFLKYGARLEVDDLATFEYYPVTSPELVS